MAFSAQPRPFRPRVVIITQVTSRTVFEMANTVATSLANGDPRQKTVLLISGNTFDEAMSPNLEVWRAPKYDNSSIKSRALTWSKFSLAVLAYSPMILGRPYCLANSNPPFSPWFMAMLRVTRGWRFTARVLDVYPDAVAQNRITSENHPILKLWHHLNQLSYLVADDVITLGPVMHELVRPQVPRRTPMHIIPDWVDTDQIVPIKREENPIAIELGWGPDDLVVVLAGNLGLSHDISGLVAAARRLEKDVDDAPPVRIVFVHGGARAGELKSLADELSAVTYLPRQSEERFPYVLALGDLAIVALGEGWEGISLPSKAYTGMAAGCALLGLTFGDNGISRLIETFKCGVNVDGDDGEAVYDTLVHLRNHRQLLEEMKVNARAAACSTYSAARRNQEYVEFFESRV